jgi:hypothetical protein
MAEYPAGTVAVATVRGVPNVRIFRRDYDWTTATPTGDWIGHPHHEVTDVRPLIVLDLDAATAHGTHDIGVENILAALRAPAATGACRKLADQIESQIQPPRIPEPGLWGVVEAGFLGIRSKWVRMVVGTSDECHWCDEESRWADWDHLVDPTLVRPGIEDAS